MFVFVIAEKPVKYLQFNWLQAGKSRAVVFSKNATLKD